MQLAADTGLSAFRATVRDFIAERLPPDWASQRRRSTYNAFKPVETMLGWTAILHEAGWSVPHWPVEHGGTGWNPMQQFVFQEELALADAPAQNVQGTHLAGPIVWMFGSDAQKALVLPGIREGRECWAQGFSEPGSGSDLASLRTFAERRGDRYVVNGQKIWTSGAYHSHWGFFLVRTSRHDKPQQGISFLLVPMDSPGMEIRRIPQINDDAHLCEVFLTDVEVPVEYLVGEPGRGWDYAKALLDLERTDSAFIYLTKREIRRLRRMLDLEAEDGTAPRALAPLRLRVARAAAQAAALEWSVLRVLGGEQQPHSMRAVASALKVRGAELQQTITEIQMDILGLKALRRFGREEIEQVDPATDSFWHDEVPGRSFSAVYARAATIYGGTLQVQRSIIAKSAFGL